MSDRRSQSVSETKVSMKEAQAQDSQATPLRILHLSDLHVGAGADPVSLLQPLVSDLTDPSDLAVDHLDYLVISGDITNRADPAEFKKALELVSSLRERFGLTAERCIIVPGNHDLDWKTRVYEWHSQLDVDVKRLPAERVSKDSFRASGMSSRGETVRCEAREGRARAVLCACAARHLLEACGGGD